MKMEFKTMVLIVVAVFVGLAFFGPDGPSYVALDVRTFPLENLRSHEAIGIVEPYVYGDREGSPGAISVTEGVITVRETRDNLDKIERVLAEYDEARPDVRLHFQLIEADGFTESDPSIAEVEDELRKIFQFRGYRLAGEAFVSASTSNSSDISQIIRGSDDSYGIQGQVWWVAPGQILLDEIHVYSMEHGTGLQTSVNIRDGQTLVLGSSPKAGSTATLFVTVRAEAVPSSNQ